jgi:hypothetical protein
MSVLVEKLKSAAPEITASVVRQMYKNPFWEHRFGARGRKFTEEDGFYHLQYLEQAYVANDAQIISSYARWLRSVLTSRGMTTRHLAGNFQLIRNEVAARFAEDAAPLTALLEAAEQALLYEEQPARELQEHSIKIGERALSRLSATHSAWAVRPIETPGVGAVDLFADLLSYAADAIAMSRPEVFGSYVELLRSLVIAQGITDAELNELLGALLISARESTLSATAKDALEQMFPRTHTQEPQELVV